jgi:hypothetical protein
LLPIGRRLVLLSAPTELLVIRRRSSTPLAAKDKQVFQLPLVAVYQAATALLRREMSAIDPFLPVAI